MFPWIFKSIRYGQKRFYQLVDWKPSNWFRAAFGKTKYIPPYRIPSLLCKYIQDIKNRYDLFTDESECFWVLTDDYYPCRIDFYDNGFIHNIDFYANDTRNINWLINACRQYAFKHKYRIAINNISSTLIRITFLYVDRYKKISEYVRVN